MNTYRELVENLTNGLKTTTENGDITYTTTLNKNLDFYGQAASKFNDEELVRLFEKAYKEDREVALKNLIFLRDIKKGQGRRHNFKVLLNWLGNNHPKVASELIWKDVVQFGRWDDLFALNNTKVEDDLFDLIKAQLEEDLRNLANNESISLLAKWLPSESSKNQVTKKLAKKMANRLFNGDKKGYRKVISSLRKYLDVLERRLSKKDYTFEYTSVPGKALIKYKEAFERNDGERFSEFLEQGKETLKKRAENLAPYEIVQKLKRVILSNNDDATLYEELWKAFSKEEMLNSCLVVRDGSGSMDTEIQKNSSVTALDVATSLAIYTSERLTGNYKDKFITFSSRPKAVDLSKCKSLKEKLLRVYKEDEIAHTNIAATYELIYNLAVLEGKAPDYLLILSDMEFDEGSTPGKTTLDEVKEKFEKAGINFPKIVWWNLNNRRSIFPEIKKEDNLFISGFAKTLFTQICESDEIDFDAEEFMLDSLKKYNEFIKGLDI